MGMGELRGGDLKIFYTEREATASWHFLKKDLNCSPLSNVVRLY